MKTKISDDFRRAFDAIPPENFTAIGEIIYWGLVFETLNWGKPVTERIYTQREKEAISQMIDDLPALFYGRDDNVWEDTVLSLARKIATNRLFSPVKNDPRQTHAHDDRQAEPL